MSMEYFAKKIKDLRESQHMTTRRMAEIVGVTNAAISYYENCKREPTLSVMEAYSNYFNVSLDELVEWAGGNCYVKSKKSRRC